MNKRIETVDEYISGFPGETGDILRQIRKIIKDGAPDAVESIAYGMPAYKTNKKPLIYFAAFANHIGLYATPSAHEKFKQALSGYKQGKGSVQFPIGKAMPYHLISEIVKLKAAENKKE